MGAKMFEKIKQGANLIKFKADQFLREQQIHSEINIINQEIKLSQDKLSEMVINLQKKDSINIPEVDELVSQVDTILTQITQKEAEIDLLGKK